MQRKTVSGFGTAAVLAALMTAVCACDGGGAKGSMQQNLISSKAYRLSIRTDGSLTFATPTKTTGPVSLPSEVVLVLRALEMYENGDMRVAFTFGPANFGLGQGSAVLDQTFMARISPRGRLSDFSGLDEIQAHVRALPKPGAPGELGDPELLTKNLTEDSLLALLNPALEIWPPVPVAPGDTWTREPIYDPNTKLYEHTTFKLNSAGTSVSRIAAESVFRSGKEPDSEQKGSATGEIQVAPSQGILRSSETKAKRSWDAEGPEGTSTITSEQTIYVTFVPL